MLLRFAASGYRGSGKEATASYVLKGELTAIEHDMEGET